MQFTNVITDFNIFTSIKTKKSQIPFQARRISSTYELLYSENNITDEFKSQLDSFMIIYTKDGEEKTSESKEILFIKKTDFPTPNNKEIKAKKDDLTIAIPFDLLFCFHII